MSLHWVLLALAIIGAGRVVVLLTTFALWLSRPRKKPTVAPMTFGEFMSARDGMGGPGL